MAKGTCTIEGCDKPLSSAKWCGMHYQRWRRTGDPLAFLGRKKYGDTCVVDGCEKKHLSKGLCAMHYLRVQKDGNVGPAQSKKRADGEGAIMPGGYVSIQTNGRRRLRHRVVMEGMLGRPLDKGENVHHKNGIPGDDRPENLEVWVTPQPSGQRPEDLAVWVVEHYPSLVKQALRGKRGDDLHLF